MTDDTALVDERTLSRLKWSCRRGLLENDLFIDRFFQRYEPILTLRHARGLSALMDLSDYDLLDLHLARKTLADIRSDLVRDDVTEVLSMLRTTVER
jgi:antitoxin CptB